MIGGNPLCFHRLGVQRNRPIFYTVGSSVACNLHRAKCRSRWASGHASIISSKRGDDRSARFGPGCPVKVGTSSSSVACDPGSIARDGHSDPVLPGPLCSVYIRLRDRLPNGY